MIAVLERIKARLKEEATQASDNCAESREAGVNSAGYNYDLGCWDTYKKVFEIIEEELK